jgi:4-diphosphocytidyl-2-C-methyl-D-erythritol kinase
VFADFGDHVGIEPADELGFEVTGPFGGEVPRTGDNLVIRARDAMLAGWKGEAPAFRLVLDKRLPIASGLGGGSGDAAATLRLLETAMGKEATDLIALSLGSDVPACLAATSTIAQGRGEILTPAPALPPIDAVLVNPMLPSPTGRVYAEYDRSGAPGEADEPELPPMIGSTEELAAILGLTRNDLEAPAIALQPAIGEVLDLLRDEPETLMARMSGSGATCFALCAGALEADSLAERVALMRPDWWVQPCRLGGYA